METMKYMTEHKILIKWLVIIIAVIILINIVDELLGNPSWQITRLFGVGLESNFSTWFSSILWAIAAYMAYQCHRTAKSKNLISKAWTIVSLFLIFLSCDETAMMHESFADFFNKYFFKLHLGTIWVIFFAPFILLVILYFVITLPKYLIGSKKAAILLLVGLGLFIFGSMILEQTITFTFYKNLPLLLRTIRDISEESFEMFGALFIIMGLMSHQKVLASKWVN